MAVCYRNDQKLNLVSRFLSWLIFFDSEASKFAKTIKPSNRGELEITDLIKIYLYEKKLALEILDESIVWHDTGNAKSLLEAAQKVKLYEQSNDLKIGSYEIASYEQGFINKSNLNEIAEKLINSDYGKYIKEYLKNN